MRRKRKNSTLLCVFRASQQEPLTLVAQPPLPATDKQLALNDQATQCTGPSPRFCTCSFVCLHVSCNSASERWVKCNWWSRHRVNLTGISVLSTPENVQRLLQSEWNRDDRCVSPWHTDCCEETTHMLVSFSQADPCSLFQAESKSVWRALQWQIDPCAANA